LVLNELQEIQFIVKISLEDFFLFSYKKLKIKKSKEGQGEE